MRTTKNALNKSRLNRILYPGKNEGGPVSWIKFSSQGLEAAKKFHSAGKENTVYNVTVNQKGDVYAVVTHFSDGTRLVTITGEKEDTKVRAPKNMRYFFFNTDHHLKTLDVSGLDVSKVESFYGCFERLGYSTNIAPDYEGVKIVGLDQWNTSSATNMSRMFMECNNRVKNFSLDLSSFDFRNATDLSYMLKSAGAYSEKVELEGLEQKEFLTSAPFTFQAMFMSFGLHADFCLDLSGWKNELCKNEASLEVPSFASNTFLKIKKPDWIVEIA